MPPGGKGGHPPASLHGRLVPARSIAPFDIDAYAPFNAQEFYRTFRHETQRANGIRQHYVIGGSGPTIMLLNGSPETWFAYHKVMPALARAGYTVIAVDVRGTGATDKPDKGYDAGSLKDDLRALLQALDLTDAVNLVAYDIFARAAYAWVTEHPEEVRRLILYETLLPGFGLEQAMNVAEGGSYHFGFFAQVETAAFLVEAHEEAFLRSLIDDATANQATHFSGERSAPIWPAGRNREGRAGFPSARYADQPRPQALRRQNTANMSSGLAVALRNGEEPRPYFKKSGL